MRLGDKLHAKRASTEAHVRDLEKRGSAGNRWTATMPDVPFMLLGLTSDVGWILQLAFGIGLLAASPNAPVALDLLLVVAGVAVTCYLGAVHEKEIALRWQKDASFGLVALGGLVGFAIGVAFGSVGLAVGGALNAASSLPIWLSFRRGITYGIR